MLLLLPGVEILRLKQSLSEDSVQERKRRLYGMPYKSQASNHFNNQEQIAGRGHTITEKK